MLRRSFLAAAAGAFTLPRSHAEGTPPPVAFRNVTAVPMDVESVVGGQTVLTESGRIAAIGPVDETTIPDGSEVIDGTNQYLMPGLCDLHTHVYSSIAGRNWANDLFLYLANGITTIRDMWAVPGILERRRAIQTGAAIAPRMLCASPGMDGPGGARTAVQPPISTPDEGRRMVASYRRQGYDFIKVYSSLPPDTFAAICQEAHAQNIPVIGHVPSRVPLFDAMDAGLYDSEHFLGTGAVVSPTRYLTAPSIDLARLGEVARTVASSPMWKCGVLAVRTQTAGRVPEFEARPEMRFVSPEMLATFRDPRFPISSSRSAELANAQAVLRAMFAAGARLVAGTDSGYGYVLPGFSFADELRWTADAGLSPYETLRLATVNAAIHLGQERELGTIEVGKAADLILLRANPLEDVANLQSLAGVMSAGGWLSDTVLRETLERIAQSYGRLAAPVLTPALVPPAAPTTSAGTATGPLSRRREAGDSCIRRSGQ